MDNYLIADERCRQVEELVSDNALTVMRANVCRGVPYDDDAYENSVLMVVSGCDQGPWEDLPPWEQETVVAVAQRTARATVNQFNPLAPEARPC